MSFSPLTVFLELNKATLGQCKRNIYTNDLKHIFPVLTTLGSVLMTNCLFFCWYLLLASPAPS